MRPDPTPNAPATDRSPAPSFASAASVDFSRPQRLKHLQALSTLALVGLLASCGGGGGGSSDSAAPAPVGSSPAPAPGALAPAPAPTPAPPPGSPAPAPSGPLVAPTSVATVARGLDHPWGLAFLPNNGGFLVTERPGRLRLITPAGAMSSVSGLPPRIFTSDQGGLLDIALDPNFSSNNRVFLSYSETDANDAGVNSLAVASATLNASRTALTNVQVIYTQRPRTNTPGHFGGRLVFRPDGTLFVTLGDRQSQEESVYAQDLSRGNGKVVRINTDGSVPADNPFVSRSDAQPQIWSYGHRNPQGAAINPATGELWSVEHGPQGGDELNVVRSGRNYGWPSISYGCDYGSAPVDTCTTVGGATARDGMEQPVTYWVPRSTAPSGLMFYDGNVFTAWRGKAFAGALSGRSLWQFDLDQPGPVVCTPRAGQTQSNCSEVAIVKNLNTRIRDVRQGPDGKVYLLTDGGNTADAVLRLD